MPRSVCSDFMDIHSTTDSYDTWSRYSGDDVDSRHEHEQYSRRYRRRRMDYSDGDNSIVESTAGGSSSATAARGLNDTRTTTTTSGVSPLKDSRDESNSPVSQVLLTHEQYEAARRMEYMAGRRQMYNPFDDASVSEASSLPSDERLSRTPSQGSLTRRQQQQSHPWHQPNAPLYGTGSLLDDESQQGPLSPVEEDSASAVRGSYGSSSEFFSQPSDEQGSISRVAQEAQEQLRRTFHQRRQTSQEQVRRIVEMQQGGQDESQQQHLAHPRHVSPEQLPPPRDDREQYPDPSYCLSLSSSMKKSSSVSDPSTGEETVSSDNDEEYEEEEEDDVDKPHLALHDLCSEATSPDDVAWRNALYLLSLEPQLATIKEDGWSPLHVSCLGSAPPPDYMVRALLYCEPACARAIDAGGRLPLHMIAASSADPTIMQLLVDEYPQAVYKTDSHGYTPLHMLMRNEDVPLTMDRVRILLGQTVGRGKRVVKKERVVQRRGQHLEMNIDEINNRMVNRQGDNELNISFESLDDEQKYELEKMMHYPDDVKVSFQKLAMWKRKQKRIHADEDIPINIELARSLQNEEKNPAAVAVPQSGYLALHMALRRREPADEPFDDEDEDDYYYDVKNPPPNRNEIIRVLISAFPRGLVTRDAHGHTPLTMVLLNQECLPDIELIQLLLGLTTSGFQSPPTWADDLPLHESPEGKYVNPAMVPTTDTGQLPLHVAAEEMPSFYAAIESIHSAYPGAVVVQDFRGRTPLHMALRNYQRIQPDPKVVSLLLTDKVAQIRDDDGFLPFDLLVGGAHNLPKSEPMPSLWEDSTFDPSSVYKRFFIYVVMQAPRPRNRIEALAFLQRLRMLPPWLRRQACSVGFIQDMLVYEMASPEKTAFILFNGVLWAVLLVTFRLQMNEYTTSGSAESYYAPVINLLSSLVLVGQFINWCISASLSVFVRQCLLNIWPWIDIASVSVTIAATSFVQGGSMDTNHVAAVGTAATGLLWASVIGYFARWWYGMAVFMGRTLRMFHVLVWPLVALVVLIVASAEMFYTFNLTTSQEDCEVVLGGRSLCTIREAFITVYLMLLGTPLIDTEDGSQNSLSSGAVVLISVFTALLVLFIVSLLISVVSEAVRIDLDDVALGYFWEPKLNFVFSISDFVRFFTCSKDQQLQRCDGIRKGKDRIIPKRTLGERLSSALGDAWTVIDYAILGGERRRGNMWYIAYCDRASPFGVWPLRILCLIILPIWLAVGLATLGLLWPPQVRRWLFRPSRSSVRNNRDNNAAAEYSATQVAGMRGDVLQLKTMSYERSNDIKQDILELKRLLYDASVE